MTNFADTISSEEPERSRWHRLQRETPPTGAGVRTTAMSAALTLVVSAGVATAAYRGTSDSPAPETLIPSSAFAVATADLSLPGGQAGALETLLGRFPGLHLKGDGSIRDRVLRTMLSSWDSRLDYDEDFKPWLGDHFAVAGWNRDGKPEMEVVLQSTDDAAARKSLNAFTDGDGSVVMHDGYAIVGNNRAAVDDAIAAAAKSSLADTGPYAGDVNALPDNEAITGWLDGPATKDVLRGTTLGGEILGGPESLALSGLGTFGPGLGDVFKGRLALGVHVTDTIAQLDVRSVGGLTTKSAPASMLTELPAGTIGAIELGDPGSVVDAVTPLVRIFGALGSESGMTSCYGSSSAVPVPPTVPGLSPQSLRRQLRMAVPPGTPHRRALIRAALRHYHKALARARHNNSGAYSSTLDLNPDECTSTAPAPTDPFAEIQKFLGINFPDDVKTILGDRTVVAFGGLEIAGIPDIAIRSHPSDLTTAQSLASTLSSTLATETPVTVDVSTAGDDLVLATSSTYGAEIAKTGSLGEQEQAKTALAGMPDNVNVAVYVDLSRIWPLLGDDVPDGIRHLRAVGFWAASTGNVQTAQLRVVMG